MSTPEYQPPAPDELRQLRDEHFAWTQTTGEPPVPSLELGRLIVRLAQAALFYAGEFGDDE